MSRVIGIVQSKNTSHNQIITADTGDLIWQDWARLKDKKSRLLTVYPSGHITLNTWDLEDPERSISSTLAHSLPAL